MGVNKLSTTTNYKHTVGGGGNVMVNGMCGYLAPIPTPILHVADYTYL